jgi:hypothetical protein
MYNYENWWSVSEFYTKLDDWIAYHCSPNVGWIEIPYGQQTTNTAFIRRFEHNCGEWIELRDTHGGPEKRTNYSNTWIPLLANYTVDSFAKDLKMFGYQEVQPVDEGLDSTVGFSLDRLSGKYYPVPDITKAEPKKCVCSMTQLMRTGCQCGGV